MPEHARRVLRVPLTPLIDVVFILLLFFMLSSSFARQQQIEFRAAATPAGASSGESRRLLLYPAGRIGIGDDTVEVGSSSFAGLLDDWRREPRKVIVAATPDVAVQDLVALLDRLRTAAVGEIDLAGTVQP